MSKQKLIEFMMKKEKIISGAIGEPGKYFNNKDKYIIECWSDEECEIIWDEIVSAVKHYHVWGLRSATCPFCYSMQRTNKKLQNENYCLKCSYADNHGGFTDTNSSCCVDWNFISFGFDDGINIHTLLLNSNYIQFIYEVESVCK